MSSAALPLASIDCAILVGGLGTRLRGLVDDVPKPLAPVLGRPFLFYLLDMLALRGARSVTLCSGHLAGLVREQAGIDWLGMPIHHSVETTPLGTGGALAQARGFLRSDQVLVMNGDTWFEPAFDSFAAAAGDSAFCIAAADVPDASRYGSLEWDDSGRMTRFLEKSASTGAGPINAGVYLVSQGLLSSLQAEPLSLERQVLPRRAVERQVKVFPSDAPFLDIGIPADYAAAAGFFQRLGIAPHGMFPDAPPMARALPKLGTCAVILDESGRVVLEQRADCGWWCLPGGRLDPGETLSEGAVREAREETGLDIEITGFLGVFSDPRRRTVRYPDHGDLRQLVDAAVLARPIASTLVRSHESFDLRWFAPNEIPLNTVPPVVEILRQAWGWNGCPILR
jgi:8-oxo-dGTP pyrophosphatase MutT (NUDIX family)/UTP-glucose-1-phosphate uridylyltransferase